MIPKTIHRLLASVLAWCAISLAPAAEATAAAAKIPIIIDTDPGIDDAVALLLAAGASDLLEIKGITVVAGNVPLARTERNARLIRDWTSRTDLPVYAGCPGPMLGRLVTEERVNGVTGLAGAPDTEPSRPLAPGHAVTFLVETLRAAPEHSITICALGPLTNIATALIQSPEIKRGIKAIVLMGGARESGGNASPVAEFNIFVDPYAADVVFRSGVPLVVLPREAALQALATPERCAPILALRNEAGKRMSGILQSYLDGARKRGMAGAPMYDPCVIAYLLQPGIFKGRRVNVVIETKGEWTTGETVVDWRGTTKREPNALWLNETDADAFFALMAKEIARLP